MEYSVSHKFQINVERFIKLYFDNAYNDLLDKELGIRKRELLKEQNDQEIMMREYRVFPEREIPAPLRKLIPKNKLSYIERREFTKGGRILNFFITPGILKGKIQCQGKCILRPSGKNSVLREIKGKLIVSIPIVGRGLERIIANDILESLERAAALTRQYYE